MPHNQTDEKVEHQYRRGHSYLVLKTALSMLLLAVTAAGCALDMEIRMGRRPNLSAIEQRLRVGQSTTDDVLAVLGPPGGKGFAMLPIDPRQRTTWSYTYFEGFVQPGGETRGDMRGLMLFVFFEQDRYAGYMWFSSIPE